MKKYVLPEGISNEKNEENRRFLGIASTGSGGLSVRLAASGASPITPFIPPISWELHCVQSASPLGFAAAKGRIQR
jgi:hypothetical protein